MKNYNLYILSIASFVLFGGLAFMWLNSGFLGGLHGFQIAITAGIFLILGVLLFFGGLARNSK